MDSDYINRNVADIFSKKFSLEDTLTYKIKFDNLFKSDPWKVVSFIYCSNSMPVYNAFFSVYLVLHH